jgi:hypothetical protein
MDSYNIKDIRDVYESIYYTQENIFDDIVEFCLDANIFESIEETEYFANLIIYNDLVETFVDDVFEYCLQEELLDESYITEVSAGAISKGLKFAGGLFKKTTPAARGLSTKTMVKKGLRPTGLSSKGKALSGAAKTDDIARTQAARAARKPPEPEKANRYGEMLAQKKAATPTSASKPAAKSGRMTPSYVAKRGITDTLATSLALGMGHMAGLKPVTNALKQMTTPIVRTVAASVPKSAPKALPAAGQTSRGPKPKFKPEALPKPTPSATTGGKLATTTTLKTGLSPQGQEIQRLNKMIGGGIVGTRKLPKSTAAPKPAWGSDSSSKSKTTPGQAQRSVVAPSTKPATKPSQKTPEPPTGGGKPPRGGGLTHTVRATLSPTEKTGNMRYPGLEKYATGSGPGTGGAKPSKKSLLGPAIGVAAAGAAAADSERQQKKQQKATSPSGVSNIEKPKTKFTGEDVRKSFDAAFATERRLKGSKGTFKWTNPSTGKAGTYTTKMAEEFVDNFDYILEYLVAEGYADTNQNALVIMTNMSEEWRHSIVEEIFGEEKKEFPSDKVNKKAAKHERDYLKRPNSYVGQSSKLKSKKMRAIKSTVDAGGDPRNTMHGQDLRKIKTRPNIN